MAELKTRPSGDDVERFLSTVPEPAQSDCRDLVGIMAEATGAPPVMWGRSIVGFGEHHYRYASGREGDWFEVGFSPRARSLTLYLTTGVERHRDLLDALGRHTTGKGCVYVKRLDDVDREVLGRLVRDAVAAVRSPGAGDHRG